ncbi:DUF2842 domain-containing protein [Aestuariibius sp. HNIBRBA575]|uniref:DUF2842 domain-containing protein n=1 Tax=Aestuariibius sp. HNIBRBA575 TaxID=3233343 RepID=UPI0034A53257
MTYKSRKKLALFILLIGMPAYVVFAVTVMNRIGSLPNWVEFPIYVMLGIGWIFPLKKVFMGIGQADPDAPRDQE